MRTTPCRCDCRDTRRRGVDLPRAVTARCETSRDCRVACRPTRRRPRSNPPTNRQRQPTTWLETNHARSSRRRPDRFEALTAVLSR